MMVLDAQVCVSCLQKLFDKKASGLHYTGALVKEHTWGCIGLIPLCVP